jgi:hypothetical protein
VPMPMPAASGFATLDRNIQAEKVAQIDDRLDVRTSRASPDDRVTMESHNVL